jgi:hypothetical protein
MANDDPTADAVIGMLRAVQKGTSIGVRPPSTGVHP